MKLNKIVLVLILSFGLLFANTKEQININFKGLKISDLIKITSKIINKNILLTYKVNGTVDFISNKPIYKDDILNILIYVLEEKGYTVVENKGLLRVIRINDVAKYNAPVFSNTANISTSQMLTEVFVVKYANVDYISSKIRHLISKSAKLITDKNSNSIVITDFLENIKTVKKVINIISEDSKKTIETVNLKNMQASEIINDLKGVAKTVFNEKIEKEKVAILLNKDTNSIMFVGKESNVKYLKKYLLEIENKGSLVEKIVEVIYLKNVEAKNIITILNGVVTNKEYKNKNDKPFVSKDEESNSIILMGQKEELNYFIMLIKKLDVDRPQVYVKARIIEVNENRADNIGVKYGLSGGALGNDGLFSFAADMGGSVVAPGVANAINTSSDLTRGLALGATINLLKKNQAVDIVSEPSLLCINNKESSIYVGETKTFQTGATSTTANPETTNITYKREDIGLTLKVKPRISTGGKVTLEISVVVEDAKVSVGANPDTSKKDLQTTAIVSNGEAVILGGYIKKSTDYTEEKVPFFGDIPFLGALFRNNIEEETRINLVIIITPYIVPTSSDLTTIREQLSELKVLEDKYTQDLEVRLEERKFKIQKDTHNRKLAIASIQAEQEEFRRSNAKKINPHEKRVKEIDDEKRHKQRVKDMFGQ